MKQIKGLYKGGSEELPPAPSAPVDDATRIRLIQVEIDRLTFEIDKIAKAKIPDFHFLNHKVSSFWGCKQSPIGMCVWNLIEGRFTINCKCRYCGEPVERK